jgi:hypothetical protein
MNLQKIIGKTPEEARKNLKGRKLRIAVQDGERKMLTMDYDPKRVNVSTTEGKISSIVEMG